METPIQLDTNVEVLPPPQACPVCKAGQLGFTRTQAMLLGKTTAMDVATELGCTREDVMRHINEQHEIQMDVNGDFRSPDFYLDKLLDQYNSLQKWTDYVLELVKGANDINPQKINMLVQLSREIRETIKTLGEFQGRKSQQDTVYVQKMEKQVEQMTYIVLEETCPVCRQKVLAAMGSTLLPKEKPLLEKTSSSIPSHS